MARQRKYDDRFFTKEELEEIKMLSESVEVKLARKEARERAYQRSRLYNLRSLYKRGAEIIQGPSKEKRK